MGLDTTHNCWHGPYSCFSKWREHIATVVGINLDNMIGFGGDIPWEGLPADPIHTLLDHSDCDGEIVVADLLPLADRLEELLPKLDAEQPLGCSHRQSAVDFIDGLRLAASLNEPVEFR